MYINLFIQESAHRSLWLTTHQVKIKLKLLEVTSEELQSVLLEAFVFFLPLATLLTNYLHNIGPAPFQR